MAAAKILIVEDERSTLVALGDTLALLGYDPIPVENAHQALQVLQNRHTEIDLVLSDVVMPDMSGIALFRTIRQRGLSVPVILMTGHPMQAELDSLEVEGLVGWMFKPPTLRQLAEIISQGVKSPPPATSRM